jgi:hypothetical protein
MISPARALRAHFGSLGFRVSGGGRRVDNYFPFSCGNYVTRRDDQRHNGQVVAVISNTVRVRWANNWLEDCDPRDLERHT